MASANIMPKANIILRIGASNMVHSFARRAISTSLCCHKEKQAKFFPPRMDAMLPKDCFKNKVAFITGGGTGLGRSMARMLADRGAQVTIVSRKLEALQKTADEILQETGQHVVALPCDVRDPHNIREAVSECTERLGLPHIIINNAAGNFISPTERLSNNAWKTIIDIVLNGTANVTLEIGKRLISAKQGGAFLNISTTYVETGSAFVAPSASAKAGVEALTKSLASEWAKFGMRFNCIQPGPIITEGAFGRLDPMGDLASKGESRLAVGRFGEREELANLACYLVSDYASWMTGSIVRFDGGELNMMGGEFNELVSIPKEQWDMIEDTIRKTTNSTSRHHPESD